MTDSEIIKALENKVHGSDYACFEDYEILDIIKRQQTEINKLEKARQKQGNFLVELRQQKYELMNRMPLVKNEAYKEFAEKLKEEIGCCHIVSDGKYCGFDCGDIHECIDDILKELEG